MTRKTMALLLAIVTTTLVVLLCLLFAWLHNRAGAPALLPPAAAPPAPRADGGAVAAGRSVYERLQCSACHAIAGRGNPRAPLDGVGSRRSRAELRDWTTGAGKARDALPAAIARRKARFGGEAELEALLDYLASLR